MEETACGVEGFWLLDMQEHQRGQFWGQEYAMACVRGHTCSGCGGVRVNVHACCVRCRMSRCRTRSSGFRYNLSHAPGTQLELDTRHGQAGCLLLSDCIRLLCATSLSLKIVQSVQHQHVEGVSTVCCFPSQVQGRAETAVDNSNSKGGSKTLTIHAIEPTARQHHNSQCPAVVAGCISWTSRLDHLLTMQTG